jgi:hypothetical protein
MKIPTSIHAHTFSAMVLSKLWSRPDGMIELWAEWRNRPEGESEIEIPKRRLMKLRVITSHNLSEVEVWDHGLNTLHLEANKKRTRGIWCGAWRNIVVAFFIADPPILHLHVLALMDTFHLLFC